MRSAASRTIWAMRWRHARRRCACWRRGARCWTSATTRRSDRGIRCLWRCARRSWRAICRASLFHDLLRAFRQDQIKTHYETWDEAVEYSRYSANPVGRLVLMVCGYRDEERALLSDKICTALQLANFWQDVVRDAEIPRRYHSGGVHGAVRRGRRPDRGPRVYAGVRRDDAARWWSARATMLREGAALPATVDPELRVTLDLFRKGGEAILDGIAAQDYDVLRGRPVVTKRKKADAAAGRAAGQAACRARRGVRRGVSEAADRRTAARHIASAARSRGGRRRTSTGRFVCCRGTRAMRCARCMRLCGGRTISRTTSRSRSRRGARRWRAWLERVASFAELGRLTADDPVFVALGDTQRRFAIPDELLEELVAGTTMDLEPRAADADGVQTYATFEDLYRVLLSGRFGGGAGVHPDLRVQDARAEKLAEETGVAFQLTNILRDVKEDVERGRVYLPLDLLDEFGETIAELRELAAGRAMTERERGMLATLAIRAEKYYVAADKLIPCWTATAARRCGCW